MDCAEGTTRQFHTQPRGHGEQTLRAQKVTKLFVTHMHGGNCCLSCRRRHGSRLPQLIMSWVSYLFCAKFSSRQLCMLRRLSLLQNLYVPDLPLTSLVCLRWVIFFHRAASRRNLWPSWLTHLCPLCPYYDPHQDGRHVYSARASYGSVPTNALRRCISPF